MPIIDEIFEVIFDVILEFIPTVVQGVIGFLAGLLMTAVGVMTVSEPGLLGETLTVLGVSTVGGVLVLWCR